MCCTTSRPLQAEYAFEYALSIRFNQANLCTWQAHGVTSLASQALTADLLHVVAATHVYNNVQLDTNFCMSIWTKLREVRACRCPCCDSHDLCSCRQSPHTCRDTLRKIMLFARLKPLHHMVIICANAKALWYQGQTLQAKQDRPKRTVPVSKIWSKLAILPN